MTEIQTADIAYVDLPGITHVDGVIRSEDRPKSATAAAVLMAVGMMTDKDLRSPNGYNGHTCDDVAGFFSADIMSLTSAQLALAALVADGHLVTRPSVIRAGMDDGERFGDAAAAIFARARVFVPDTIRVAVES